MAKKQYKPTAVDFLEVEGKLFAQTTKKNDLITITSDLDKPVFVKASKGTDSISFEGINTVADLQDRSKITFKHVEGTKNLEIDLLNNDGSVKQTVTIEKYFKKVDGKATASSIKNVQLTDGGVTQYVAILDQALIDYDQVIVAKKKKATGTAFNDVISGSIQNDTIKGGAGDDTLYGDAGNDKLYGGKGKDTFIFDSYSKENKMTGNTEYYGSGKDTVYDADVNDTLEFKTSGIEQIKFEQVKNNLVITYSDVEDVASTLTKENTVTVKNYFKQKEENRVKNIVAMDADGNATEYTFSEDGKVYKGDEQVNLVKVHEQRMANKAAAEAKAAEDARKAAEYDGLVKNLADTQEELATTQGVLEQTEANLETATENYKTAKTNYETTKAAFEAYEEEHLKTNAEYQAMSDAKDEAQANYEAAQADYNTKKAELDAYTASHTYNNTEYALLEQQKDTAAANYETAQANYEAKAQALAVYEATHQHDNVAYNNLVQAKEKAEADFTAYAANHSKTDAEYQAKEAALADATQALADYEESHSHDDTEWSNLVQEKDTATANYNTAKANYEQAQADLTAYTASHTYDNTQYALLEQQKDTATTNYNTAKANYEQAQADLTAYTATHQYDNVEYNNLVQQKALAEQALTDYKSTHSNTDAQYQTLEQAKAAADAALTAYEESHSHDDTEWGELLAAKNTAQSNYETAQANYEQATSDLEAYQETHSKTDAEYDAKVAELTQAQADLATAQSEKTAAENALEVYTANHSRTNEEYQAMSDAKDAAELARDAAITDKETAETALTNYQNTHTHDNTEWTTLTAQKDTAVANYEAAQASLLAKVSELATYEANHLKTNAEYQALEQAKAAADQALTDYKANHNNTDAEYQALEQAKADADQALIDYKEDYAHSNTEYQAKVDAVTAAETARDAAITDKETAEAALTAYKENHRKTDAEYDAKVAEVTAAETARDAAIADKETAEAALAAYQANHSKTDAEYATLAEQKADALADLAAAQATVTTLTGEKAALENQVSTLTTEKAALQDQLDAIAAGAKDYSEFEDKVLPATKASEYDRLVFANSSFTNCDFTQNGDDLVITYHDDKGGTSEEGTLTLKDYFKPTTTNKIDTFVDKDGNQHSITDALNGGSAPEYDSVINGTEGDDEFTPSADKALFIPNGGNDVITSADYEHNKMMLPGNIADVSYGRVNNDDLMVFYKGGTVTLKDYFKDNGNLNTMILNGVEYNIADDITTKTLYDVRMGTSGNDEFETEYAEIFVTKGGNDVIDYYSGSGGYETGDKIKISGTRADVTYSEDAESNLIVTYSGGTVKILNNSKGTLDFGQIKLITDDAEFDIATDMAQKSSGGGDEYTVVDGSDGSDEFTPTSDKEIFVVGGGSDTFNSVGDSTYVEGDKIQLTDTTKQSDVTYSRTVGDNDLVVDYGDNNSVTLKDYFNPAKYTPGKIVTDDAEFDIASDMATKGVTVNGTSGDNTFTPTDLKEIFDAGDGDVINYSDSYQKVKGDGIKVSTDTNVEYIVNNDNRDDLVIYNTSSGYSVTLDQYFDNNPNHYSPENIVDVYGAEYSIDSEIAKRGITVNGTSGNDDFDPTSYKEIFVVAGGNDRFCYSSEISTNNNFDDKIQIEDDINNITYSRTNSDYDTDLVINYNSGTVKFCNYVNSPYADYYPDTLKYKYDDYYYDYSIKLDIAKKGVIVNGTNGNDEFNKRDSDGTTVTYVTDTKETFVVNGGDDVFYYESGGYYIGDKVQISGYKADVSYSQDGDDLIINYTGGTVKFADFFNNDEMFYPAMLKTEDAEFYLAADMAKKGLKTYTIVEGTTGNDTFNPTLDKEIFVVGGGSDTFNSVGDSTYVAGDKVQLTDTTKQSDVTYSRTVGDNDLVINYGAENSVTMKGYFAEDKYSPETLVIGGEDVNLNDDIIARGVNYIGTSGSDSYTPTAYKETFVVKGGEDGFSYDSSNYAGDAIKLNCNKADISYSKDDSGNLIINYGSGNSVILYEYYNSSHTPSVYPQTLITNDNDGFNIVDDMADKGYYIDNGDLCRDLQGTSGNDTYTAAKGVKETFIVEGGNDTFNGNSDNNQGDKLKISANKSDVTYSKNGDDLIIRYGSGDTVTFKNYGTVSANYYPDTLVTADDSDGFNIADDKGEKGYTIFGTSGNDTFTANDVDLPETFIVAGGNDTFNPNSNNGQGDKIQISASRSDVTYSSVGDDLIINYGSNTVKLTDYFVDGSYTRYYPEILKTTDDEFSIAADLAEKGIPIYGTNGDDEFTPTSAQETFIVAGGNDTFNSNSDNKDGDKIQISGTRDDVTYSCAVGSGDFVIHYGSGTDSVTLKGYYAGGSPSVSYYPDTLKTTGDDAVFAISDDVDAKGLLIYGTSGDDEFSAGTYKEIFVTNGGNDVFSYATNSDYAGDKIKIDAYSSGVTYTQDGDDLIINYGSSSDAVTLSDYFKDGYDATYYPQILATNDGDLNIAENMATKGYTPAYTDVPGTSGTDSFTPSSDPQNFVLNGGVDTFSPDSDYGNDRIEVFGNEGDITYTRDYGVNDGTDLTIGYPASTRSVNSVTFEGYFGNSDRYPAKIKTEDGKTHSIASGMAQNGLNHLGTNGNDSFNANEGKDIYVANGGDDVISIYDSSLGYPTRLIGDTIELSGDISNISCSESETGNDLVITYDGGSTFTLGAYYHTFEDVPASGYYNNVTLKVGDTTTTVGDIVSNSSQNSLLASNNFLASLAQSTFAWQSAGTDTSMTDVTVNNPDEVNLMQIYTNNA